jgi:hypothetical protein
MARHIRQTIAEEEKSFVQKHKKVLMAVAAIAVVAGAYYMLKHGKKSAPMGARLRYYYF